MATVLSSKPGGSGGGGVPSGPAGGSLAGTYPDPTIGALAVGTAELAAGAVTAAKVAADVATQAELDAAVAALGVWASFTPTLTASVTDPTLGVASSQTGRWTSIGKLGIVHAQITFGTSGTNAGSGTYRVGLPFTVGASQLSLGGMLTAYDASAFDAFVFMVQPVPGQAYATAFWSQTATAGPLTHAVPVAWTASDQFMYYLTVEIA